MSFFRSDTILHFKLVLPKDSAWQIMNRLGENRLVHIVPSLNLSMLRPFHAQFKRCEEAIIKISYIESTLKEKIQLKISSQFPERAYDEFYRICKERCASKGAHGETLFDEIEQEIEAAWAYHQDLLKRSQELYASVLLYRENIAIIRAGQRSYGRAIFMKGGSLSVTDTQMIFKCGVIDLNDELRFKKIVFRITQGNSIVTCLPFSSLFDNLMPAQANKVVFMVLFPSSNKGYFDLKINRLVQTFSSHNYELPTTNDQFEPLLKRIEASFMEAENLYNMTQVESEGFCKKLSTKMSNSAYLRNYEFLKLYAQKEKQLYSALNEMDTYSTFLQGEIFVREEDMPNLTLIIASVEKEFKLPIGQLIPSICEKPPTNFILNDYTRSAHQIVETYGVAKYKQVNPSFFTTITFPFLFGVMFGDIAHGSLLFLFGAYLCFNKDSITNPMLRMLLPHRYLFTLMGFFAIYCGFIYNDFLSISLNLFGSCYDPTDLQPGTALLRRSKQCVYLFGLDPVWSIAENNLNFVNSLKMKISVVLGVVHMTLGVFMKAANSIHFRKYIDLVFEFIPQLIFLLLLFGYMDYLIVLKWLTPWGYFNANAPSIITTMINMPLKLGKTDICCGGQAMWGQIGNTSQDSYQKNFLYIALICIPLMLLPKPLYEIFCHHSTSYKKVESDQQKEEAFTDKQLARTDNELKIMPPQEHDSGEIMVHQLIQTIQYALGCISNTASYLRLWALSLAHSQLSEVFFEKTVEGSLLKGYWGIPGMLIGFVLLAGITIGVLLCMDTMECFLHTLRLHWVQFQNKFYKGDGYAFQRFSFTDSLTSRLALQA